MEWNCRQQSAILLVCNASRMVCKQEMKNPEGQLPRYVEDRQAFDCDLRHRNGQIHDSWRTGQIAKVIDKEATI